MSRVILPMPRGILSLAGPFGRTNAPSRDIRDEWDWEIVTEAVRPSTAIDYETAISHEITVTATSDDGSNSTGSFIVSVVNDPNDDETLNTPPTQLGGIHRFRQHSQMET